MNSLVEASEIALKIFKATAESVLIAYESGDGQVDLDTCWEFFTTTGYVAYPEEVWIKHFECFERFKPEGKVRNPLEDDFFECRNRGTSIPCVWISEWMEECIREEAEGKYEDVNIHGITLDDVIAFKNECIKRRLTGFCYDW